MRENEFYRKIVEIHEQNEIYLATMLEKDTGIKQATLGKWKKGSLPTIDKLVTLVNYFQVSSDELLGIDTKSNLTENEQELLEQFRKLSDRDQIKFIGRIEEFTKEKGV